MASSASATDVARQVILDTDAMTDVDDLGALAVLHALADRGEADILAVMTCVRHEYAAPAVEVVNAYHGRPHIPIGALAGPGQLLHSRYQAETLARRFLAQPILLTSQRPDAVDLYRRTLAGSAGKVTVITIGYANNLRDLLRSGPDQHSPLNGVALIERKVERWVNMGGNFEVRERPHAMNTTNVNWEREPAAAVEAIEAWPTEIIFVGREIGHSLRVGAALRGTPSENPVRIAYELYFAGEAKDHHCADLATVLYGVRGTGHTTDRYWRLEDGRISMRPDARFTWDPRAAGGRRREARLVDAITQPDAGLMPLPEMEKVLSELLTATPKTRQE